MLVLDGGNHLLVPIVELITIVVPVVDFDRGFLNCFISF